MTHYAVGDIQGCYRELRIGLERIRFDDRHDTLWVAGDLVNRGPDSQATLAFLYNNRNSIRCVLGNHDLHLLALYYGQQESKRSDTLDDLLAHKDCDQWIAWLRQQPLCIYDKSLDFAMVHAGIAPSWTIDNALSYSAEVQQVLQSNKIEHFLQTMYGDEPNRWSEQLTGSERLRCITNHFTRMRICNQAQEIDLQYKGNIEAIPAGYTPWFDHPERNTAKQRIIFGHWAALNGHINNTNLFGLDTGCVWGQSLTFLQLDNLDLTIVSHGES